MTSLWRRILGGSAWVEGQFVEIDNFLEPVRINFDLIGKGVVQRNVWAGGDEIMGIPGDTAGDVKLYHWMPLFFDNTSDQFGFSNSPAVSVAVYTYFVRVSNAALTFTPKIWYAVDEETLITGPTVATISGQTACSATNADYSGTDQIQKVTVTMPSAARYWAAGGTIGGVPSAGYQAWARASRDIYISS